MGSAQPHSGVRALEIMLLFPFVFVFSLSPSKALPDGETVLPSNPVASNAAGSVLQALDAQIWNLTLLGMPEEVRGSANQARASHKTEKFKSGLKWISKKEAKAKAKLHGWDKDFVLHSPWGPPFAIICRAISGGCFYVGAMKVEWDFNCALNTPDGTEIKTEFEALYNPEGAAQYDFRSYPSGVYDSNFPKESLVADESCGVWVGRYNGGLLEAGSIDKDGYIYYNYGADHKWAWDGNEYDVLIEREVVKMTLIDMTFGVPIRESSKFVTPSGVKSETIFESTSDIKQTAWAVLEYSTSTSTSWTHSIELSTSLSAEIQIGSDTFGGHAKFGMEQTYSGQDGWGGVKTESFTKQLKVSAEIKPGACLKASLTILKTEKEVPFTAKYRVEYTGGSSKIVTDKGTLKNVQYAEASFKTDPVECS